MQPADSATADPFGVFPEDETPEARVLGSSNSVRTLISVSARAATATRAYIIAI